MSVIFRKAVSGMFIIFYLSIIFSKLPYFTSELVLYVHLFSLIHYDIF